MAGGIGSRLWPISTSENPKQFIDVLGVGKSLIQLTVERFLPLIPISNFWVVTSEKYANDVRKHIPDLPIDNVLCEPEARNTAPCIAYACWKIAKKYPKANLVVTPSDAVVLDSDKFLKRIEKALDFTENSSSILTIGIKPTKPEIGYGYINVDTYIEGEVTKVLEFKEKPNLETAERYLNDGRYFWNAGIFVWNVKTIKSQINRFAPQIAKIMDELSESFYTDKENDELKRLFPICDKISIDYAVMEKSEDIYVIPSDVAWSDLGSWDSVGGYLPKKEDGNMISGENVKLYNTNNCVIHLNDSRTAVLSDLDGYVIAQLNGNLLVCKKSNEQLIKNFLDEGSNISQILKKND